MNKNIYYLSVAAVASVALSSSLMLAVQADQENGTNKRQMRPKQPKKKRGKA